MELLEGESLAHRLTRGPLPLGEVLRYGIQIGEALDRAHRSGIVHRDLKPANVMITKSGAKLLDFGLAKASASAVAGDAPTIQKDLTQEGTILGTFQYMAPEQLEGADADVRTDIFALGAVLYEMTTGQRAFDGKTRTSLIAAIVAGQPAPVRTMQPLAPSSLDHVISTCLEKDPEKRWQSARDVANELKWIGEGSSAEAASVAQSRMWPIAAAVLAVLALASSAMWLRERAKPVTPIAFSMLPPPGEVFLTPPVIAPNGKVVAFATRDANVQTLWLRRIGEIAAVKLVTGERFTDLFWSPDSKSIAYFGLGTLMRVSLDGGQPEVITRFDGYGVSGTWSRSGEILFAPRFADGLYRVPASGGDAVPVTKLDAHARETLHGYPRFLGDADHFLYLRRTIAEAPNEIYAGSLSAHVQKPVVKADALAGIWRGWLLFVRNGALYAQRFDEKKLAVTGEAQKIVDEIDYSEDSATAYVSLADDGAIVYPPSTNVLVNQEFGWYDDSGKLLQKAFEQKGAGGLALSPDESKIAMLVPDIRKGANDVYVRDLGRGISTRVTGGLSSHTTAIWSPDGQRLFFGSDRDGMYDVYSASDDGVSAAQVIWKGGDDKRPLAVSPDGTTLLASLYSAKTKNDIWAVPLNGGAPRPFIVTDGTDDNSLFSPDGKWIVYTSDRSGRLETYICAFPDGRSYQVSTDGGVGAEWNYDGSRVIFANGPTLYSADVKRDGKVATVGKPVVLFAMPKTMNGWWRSKTANRFLLRSIVDPRETIGVANYVKGWSDALK